MKIVIFECESWENPVFQQLKEEHELTCESRPLTRESAMDHPQAEAVSTFIYSDLSNDTLAQLKNLTLITTRSTGFDHIDLDYCGRRGITVCNVPDYGKNTVAEHVFGLLLTISHNLFEAIDRTRRGDFSPKGLQGFDLNGRILGVIGTGEIGLSVIGIAKGFGMRVLACDVQHNEAAARELGFNYVAQDELLRNADVITLHVPGNEKTRHLIDGAAFAKMKEGAVLINTARGQVVENQALVKALAEGKLAAAGLDVLPEEPVIREEAELLRSVYQRRHNLETLLADSVLMRLRNVVVTPHSAFNTREASDRILDTTARNIQAFAAGAPQNTVGQTGESART
ncbi:MAG: hydroxyacid dehydrogenase [Candidatus Hydrogenedentota bacterium]